VTHKEEIGKRGLLNSAHFKRDSGPLFGPGLLRLVLSLMVVLSHMSSVKTGRVAVAAFFILSGYWVTRMFYEKYSREEYPTTFYLSRFLRIWPFFAVFFLFFFLVFQFSSDPKPATYLAGLTIFGVASNQLDVLGTSWSLDIEMQFYLLLPPILAIMRGGMTAGGRTFLVVAVPLVTAFGWVLKYYTGVFLLLCFLPCFLVGILIWQTGYSPNRRAAVLGAFAFAGVAIILGILPQTRFLVINREVTSWWSDLFAMLWVIPLVPFIAWNVRQPSSRLDTHLGNISFPLYVVHFPVIAILSEYLDTTRLPVKVAIFGVVMMSSLVAYVGIDRPIETMRRRLTLRRLAIAPSGPGHL
jgi:peptidoglycan/LPS O-acetylase OafA/YrhL